MSNHPLDEVLRAQKSGKAAGMPSICSAQAWVLKTALRRDASARPVLIEATCNQVNQFGGYTGMTPQDFVRCVHGIALENGFSVEGLILGGDHLGPSPWQDLPEQAAMARAEALVQAYMRAGFTKIHLDASMKLGDDDANRPLDVELAARRTARLAKAAEAAIDPDSPPRYVIGTEVPIPGGATESENGVAVTKVQDVRRTIETTYSAFVKAGLESAWERVVAVVVQPGVEFGDDFVLDYQPEAAQELRRFAETTPFIYEAHSTDYQTAENLKALVRDHFAILKVGPALTFAFREALFALALIEAELFPDEQRSHLRETLEAVMLAKPAYWEKYYRGSPREQALRRSYSLSDRVRYYWPEPAVQAALDKLLANLAQVRIPPALLSQYAPIVFEEIRQEQAKNRPSSVIEGYIQRVLGAYREAGEA
ncbi:MAG TPA: class II D-tagatose-bisphosphate aldolase, non-catalytic subunit [Anaerolineales bacterium]|nr:class II D-tagatose-bisphosphate aldolase, non-catalytic subunit [Anaerolineales bacterium]